MTWLMRAALALLVAVPLMAAPVIAAPPLEDYGKLPSITSFELSPSGQRYAFVSTEGGKAQIVIATNKGEPMAVQDMGQLKAVGLTWAGDDHLIIATSATVNMSQVFAVKRQELAGAIVLNPVTRKAVGVFSNQTKVAKTVIGFYGTAEVGGKWYGYFGGYTYIGRGDKGRDIETDDNGVLIPDLYKVDLDTGEIERAARGTAETDGWLVGPDGTVAARFLFKRSNGAWRVVTGASGGQEIAAGVSPMGHSGIIGFGRSSGTLIIGSDDEDSETIEEIALAGGARTRHDANAAEKLLFDPATRLWVGAGSTMYAAPQQAKLRGAFRAFPDYITSLVSYSADMNTMIVFTEGKDDSGTYWIVDVAARSAKPIAAAYPSVKPEDVGPVRWFDYSASDGLALRGVLTLPPGGASKSLPLVVMPHGGPWASDQLEFNYWAQAFASRGYAVFQPNFRGSDSSTALYEAGLGEWGRKMQTDISDGVTALASQGIVDPKRACTVGWSYGGYAALAGVTIQQGIYKCAASFGGVFDLGDQLTYIRNSGGSGPGTRMWRAYLGAETKLAEISPYSLAARADAPVLLMHGKDDTVVKPTQSEAMQRALQSAGKSAELVVLPGADHWLLQGSARVTMVKSSVEFVMKHNPP